MLAQQIISVDNALAHLPAVHVNRDVAWRVGAGQRLPVNGLSGLPDEHVSFRVIGPTGTIIAIASHHEGCLSVVRGITTYEVGRAALDVTYQ